VCNTYLEAMAAGCPLIVANTGGGAEAVRDGETGFQVPPRDVPATAAALDRVLGDAQLRQRLARAARERVDEYFALDRYLDRILAVYAQAIAGAAGKPTTRA
jgi:glycosyltransferase involved in cell wall biosynthesis